MCVYLVNLKKDLINFKLSGEETLHDEWINITYLYIQGLFHQAIIILAYIPQS